MLNAKLLRLARRMEWIREQQQARNQLGLLGAEHGGLASAIGVSAQKNSASKLADRVHTVAESFAIAGSISGAGWAESAALTEGQVAAQHEKSCVGKCL